MSSFRSVSINLRQVNIIGASEGHIQKVKMNWLPRSLDINVSFPQVLAHGTYNVGGMLADLIPLHGNGPVK